MSADRAPFSMVETIKTALAQFNDQPCPLLLSQLQSFRCYLEILRENSTSLAARPKQRRNERQRVRDTVVDMYTAIDKEVFVLCVIAVPVSKITPKATKNLIQCLRQWWKTAPRPKSLTTATEELCETYSIASLISSSRKRKLDEVNGQSKSDNCSSLGTSATDLSHPDVYPDETDQRNDLSSEPSRPRASKRICITSKGPNKRQDELTSEFSESSFEPNTQEQRVFENASLLGIVEVFNQYICNAIRTVKVDGELKAAVTMAFPIWGGPVDCVMSLDVNKHDVEQLVGALFKAEVKSVGQVLHVVLNQVTLVTSSEATLKGVPDEAIIKVFGLEIYEAIADCPMRRRELEEGKSVTDCISASFAKSGLIINLYLGLERGLQIRSKLQLDTTNTLQD